MASIAKRDNGKWRARYRDAKGKEHARHFDRKTDAQKWLDTVNASKVRGDYVDPKDSRITFESYVERWMKTHVVSASATRIYRSYLKQHIIPALGGMQLGAIRRSDVQGLVTAMHAKDLAPNTMKGVYALVRQVLQSALEDRLIPSSPCIRIKIPGAKASLRMFIPTKEQVAQIRDGMPKHLQPGVIILAATGLRIGELLGLNVGDVDLENRTLRIERQRNAKNQIAKTKTPSSVRTVPIGEIAAAALAPLVEDRDAKEPLIRDEFGNALPYWTWQNFFTRRAEKLGLEITTHDLRHFAASALISGGASVKQVQHFLGHATASTTLDTYSHLWPGDEDRTRSVLDAALDGLPEPLSATLTASGPDLDPEYPFDLENV